MEDNVTDIEAQSAFDSRVQKIGKGSCSNNHNPIPRINQGGKWICPECDAPKKGNSGLRNTLPDPGHEAMVTGHLPKVTESINIWPREEGIAIPQPEPIIDIFRIYKALNELPMPNEMTQIKKLLKVKQLIKELMEEQN